jgi:hypothetical protein
VRGSLTSVSHTGEEGHEEHEVKREEAKGHEEHEVKGKDGKGHEEHKLQ